MGRRTGLLAAVLSVLAGGADAVSVLGFGLFTAHVTGNLALLGVHLATGRNASVALLLSIPVFAAVVVATRWFANWLAAAGRPTLRPLLWGQFFLLVGFLGWGVAGGTWPDPHSASGTVAVLLAVGAMAVQNALVQISLPGRPATTVMTVNLTRLGIDATDLWLRPDPGLVSRARHRAGRIWPVIVGFIVGAGAGAACYAAVGLWSAGLLLALAGLALWLAPAAPAPVATR